MAFKGTEKFSGEDVNRVFDELGADNNAATGEESTVFYAATLPEYLPRAFEIQSSILFPTLRQDDFDMEKNVILEEIGMYADQPSSVAYDNVMQAHFSPHPLSHSVLGTVSSVGAMTSDQMRRSLLGRKHCPCRDRPVRLGNNPGSGEALLRLLARWIDKTTDYCGIPQTVNSIYCQRSMSSTTDHTTCSRPVWQ